METRRRLLWCTAAVLLGLGSAVPASADDSDSAGNGDPAAAFASFEVEAQSQAVAGYLFAVGDEENRLAGARVGVAKPADVYALAAAYQRGLAAGYFYAAVLGRSAAGGAGVAPEPPPGEARGLYPSEPRQSSWEGPVTAGAGGPVVDGRSAAKATETPAGDASWELHALSVPGQVAVEGGRIASRGGPVAAGIEAESLSVLSGVNIGDGLRIETLTSRAYGLVPAAGGDPSGAASTVVEGASLNGTPVRITHAGIELAEQTPAEAPKAQLMTQVRQALAAHNIEDVRLDEATAAPQTNGVRATAGVLRVIYRNPTFGASNPQGFSGGGFELGGAAVSVTALRSAAAPALAPDAADLQPAEDSDPQSGPAAAPAAAPGPAPTSHLGAVSLPAATSASATVSAAWTGPTGPSMAPPLPPATAPPAQNFATAPTERAPAITRLAATGSSIPDDGDRSTARWTAVAFLLLGSIPLWVVLAFRLARPPQPTSSRKGS